MVKSALDAGYRYVDTAVLYKNEKSVGDAIVDSKIKREEIFITTKVRIDDINKGRNKIIESIKLSLENLKLAYIDLILLHAPPHDDRRLIESWKTMEEIVDNKIDELKDKVKFIGVSNYGIKHLDKLKNNGCRMPYANQIELSPYLQQKELVKYCKDAGIKIIAHSPLTKGEKLKDERLIKIAEKYNLTPAQLMIKWCVDSGCCVIPRTSRVDHLLENIKPIFDNGDKGYITELENFDENYFTHPKYNFN
jgi:diketogulonate reductase-like aldo/keto reductase